ncbi:MAG: futalosine hydrolase [Thermodesulfovibrionales bacterium]
MTKAIAIIAAVEFELSLIGAHLGIEGLSYHRPVKKDHIIVYLSGPGMVNAAIAATKVIERFSPFLLISTGVCGAYKGSGLDIGDIAIADTEIYGDTGVKRGIEFEDMRRLGLPILKKFSTITSTDQEIFNEIPIRNIYNQKILKYSEEMGLKARSGRFVTVTGITGDPEEACIMQRRWNAICENMEGAGVAHVALLHNIEFMEIRGVSNMAGDRDKRRWNLTLVSENCQRVLCRFIEEAGKDV